MDIKRIFLTFDLKVQFLLKANKMFSCLGFEVRQSSMAVPLELKLFPLLLEQRDLQE